MELDTWLLFLLEKQEHRERKLHHNHVVPRGRTLHYTSIKRNTATLPPNDRTNNHSIIYEDGCYTDVCINSMLTENNHIKCLYGSFLYITYSRVESLQLDLKTTK